MPHSTYLQVGTDGPLIPQWQAVFILANLARGENFPNVLNSTIPATRAALIAKGIEIGPESFDVMMGCYLRLSRAEKVALRLIDLTSICPVQDMVFSSQQSQLSTVTEACTDPSPVAGPKFTPAANADMERQRLSASTISANWGVLPAQLDPQRGTVSPADLATALQGSAGEFIFEQDSPISPSTDTTALISKQTNEGSQDRTSFEFTSSEAEVIEGDTAGDMAFLKFSAAFSLNPSRQQPYDLTPAVEAASRLRKTQQGVSQSFDGTNAYTQSYSINIDQPLFNSDRTAIRNVSLKNVDHLSGIALTTINHDHWDLDNGICLTGQNANHSPNPYHSFHTNISSAHPALSKSLLSPVSELPEANYLQEQARIEATVTIIKQGIEDFIAQRRQPRTPSHDYSPADSYDKMPKKRSPKHRIAQTLDGSVVAVRNQIAKYPKMRRFVKREVLAAKEKVGAGVETLTARRRWSYDALEACGKIEVTGWSYERLADDSDDSHTDAHWQYGRWE